MNEIISSVSAQAMSDRLGSSFTVGKGFTRYQKGGVVKLSKNLSVRSLIPILFVTLVYCCSRVFIVQIFSLVDQV